LRDVLALCEDCYQLAERRKQKHLQTKRSRIIHLACLLTLFVFIFVVVDTLAALLPLILFLWCVVNMYAALLLTSLARRWF
jgi:hypothetical protein